jgi:hypothetical protein
MRTELFIRIIAECTNDQAAPAVAAELEHALAAFDPEARQLPLRYWKMPELFEFAYSLRPAAPEIFAQLLALADDGWHHGGDDRDRSSVWNRHSGPPFLDATVRWAELQLVVRDE